MKEEFKGKLFFGDNLTKFSLQEGNVLRLTEENDIKIGRMGPRGKYLVVKVTRPNEMDEDSFVESSDQPEAFAYLKTDYDVLRPDHLCVFIRALVGRFDLNLYKDKQQTYYSTTVSGSLHEVTKEEFFKP